MSLPISKTSEKHNPLLRRSDLPEFGLIQASHVVPAIERLIADSKARFAALYSGPATWQEMVAGEERGLEQIAQAWAPVSHLHSVADTEALREAYAQAVVMLSDFHTELDQNPQRLAAYRTLAGSSEFDQLSAAQRQQVQHTLRSFRLSGAELAPTERARYRDIRRRLTELGTAFQQNLQDATDHWQMHFADADALAGLPEAELAQAADRAAQGKGPKTGYVINLEYPSYHSVLTYADDPELRETVYRAFNTRASDQGPDAGRWDNSQVMHETLALRQEMARLLGFASYAHYSLETKMVADPGQAVDFLQSLVARARPRAVDELEKLTEFALANGAAGPLQAWDIAFWSEKLRASRYAISDEELRPYFELERCLEGLFAVTGQLFGITFNRHDDVPLWHEDARYIQLSDADGTARAGVYLDLYARKGKRGGAWMANARDLYPAPDGTQLPVAFVNCNFSPPTPQRPTLLNHTELTTLYHEFGHALHHMLTRIPHPAVGGIHGVEWDAVEQPSQFLENWCWERAALDQYARHVDTGAPLPDDLLRRMLSARHFQSGMFLVRQLELGLLDLRLHNEYTPDAPGQLEAIMEQVREQVAVIDYPPDNRFLHGFGHLFAGGYAAGYYSYLWAEQLAADAFGRFREEGVLSADCGAAFRREILETGGSRTALASFKAFRGRAPDTAPLLEGYGL